MRQVLVAVLLLIVGPVLAQEPDWQEFTAAGVRIRVASSSDARELPAVTAALGRLVPELHARPGLTACPGPLLVIHPDLASYESATQVSWHQLATADAAACRVDTQRIQVLNQHGGLERTLRHEFFHLHQPAGWERWRTEGEAQRFAGERPAARTLQGLSPAELDRLLAAPADELTRLRAMATALEWVLQGR